MTRFVVLYHAPQSAPDAMAGNDDAAAAEGMQLWMDWAARAGEHLVDMGQPLGNAQEITTMGDVEAKSTVGGYSILEADSLDHAVSLMNGHPHLMMPGASIQVFEALALPGM
ncbi:hypothetical protein [Arthrobacter sp. 35W]|uniref:hypothetical protein n=1 Tax=Arthrobacter sp. 35W TaxID=1132441 RepID=UPI00040DD271|nr:hypothetical protein [Arthrobacter sp. 35W]